MIRFAEMSTSQGVVAQVLRQDDARADESLLAYGVVGDDGAFCSQGGALFYRDRPHMIHLADFCAGIVDGGAYHQRAAEDSLRKGDAFIQCIVVVDLALVADGNVGAEETVRADLAVLADAGAGEEV